VGVSELLGLAGARVVDEVRSAYTDTGPFTTVALDVGRAKETASHEIELRWRACLEELRVKGAPEPRLAALRACSRSVTKLAGEVRRTVVVAEDRPVLDLEHPVRDPSPPLVEVGVLPTLVPLLQQAKSWVPYVLVEAGRTAASVHVRVAGRPGDWAEPVVGESHHATKVHAGGWSEPKWQVRVEEVWRGNSERVADEATAVVQATGVDLVLVSGDLRVRPGIATALRERTSAEVVEIEVHTLPEGASDDTLLRELDDALERRTHSQLDSAVTRIHEGRGLSGAVGLDAVLPCLSDGQVATLLLRPAGLEQEVLVPLREAPWLGPPTVAKSLGIAPAAEVLARASLLTEADVLVVDDDLPELEQGVAASLRWDREPLRR
jgi:hypothetical protein